MFKSLNAGAIGVRGSVDELIGYAKRAGFQGVDPNIQEITSLVNAHGAEHVKGLFADAGLRIGAWGLSVNWRGDEDEYKAGLSKLADFAAAGAAVGATRVAQWVPSASEDLKFGENFRWHIDRFKPIAEILGEHGCSLGLEFIGPRTLRVDKSYGFIHSMDGMLALGHAIGTGNVGLLLDCWHWYTGLGTISDLMGLTADDVVHVHVNDAPDGVYVGDQIDNKRALPGETGVIDLVGFLSALQKIGYDGPVSPEPFSQSVREMAAQDAVQTTHDALDKSWQAALSP